MSSLAHSGCQEEFQAQGIGRRPVQAWVSCSGGRTTACDPHPLGGAQCGEQRGPGLEHSATKKVLTDVGRPSKFSDAIFVSSNSHPLERRTRCFHFLIHDVEIDVRIVLLSISTFPLWAKISSPSPIALLSAPSAYPTVGPNCPNLSFKHQEVQTCLSTGVLH